MPKKDVKPVSADSYRYYVTIETTITTARAYNLGWRTKSYVCGLKVKHHKGENYSEFRNQLESVLEKTTGHAAILRIKNWDKHSKKGMPAELIQELSVALDKNAHVVRILANLSNASSESKNSIKNSLERNRRDLNAASRKKALMWPAVGLPLTRDFLVNYAAKYVNLSTLGNVLAHPYVRNAITLLPLIAFVGPWLRQKYLNFCASYYKKPEQIEKITNKKEIKAVLAGAQATTWRTFITSSIGGKGSLNNDIHSMAFAAGEQLAVECNQEAINALKSRLRALK